MVARLVAASTVAAVLLCAAVSAVAQSSADLSAAPAVAQPTAQADQTAGPQARQPHNKQSDTSEAVTSQTPVVGSAVISSDGGILSDGGEDDAQLQKMIRVQQQRRAQLRQQLADPKQGPQIRAERVRQARAQHPEVARVLRLDGKAEQQLFVQLAEELLDQEMQPSSFAVAGVRRRGGFAQRDRDEAQRYDQRMQQIAKAIGMARLDDFVDYERSLQERLNIERFERTLPAAGKLTGEQRDGMVPLLQERQQRLYSGRRQSLAFTGSDVAMSPAERARRNRIMDVALSEQSVEAAEIANRELLERLAAILDAEQLQAFARLEQQDLDSRRNRQRQERRELGIPADAKLESLYGSAAPWPPPSTAVSLLIRIGVDGEFVDKTLTGVRGTPVSTELPQGLLLEIRRLPCAEGMVLFETEVFELVRGGRRQVAALGTSAQALGSEAAQLAQQPTSTSVARGRKGYLIEQRIVATTP